MSPASCRHQQRSRAPRCIRADLTSLQAGPRAARSICPGAQRTELAGQFLVRPERPGIGQRASARSAETHIGARMH